MPTLNSIKIAFSMKTFFTKNKFLFKKVIVLKVLLKDVFKIKICSQYFYVMKNIFNV